MTQADIEIQNRNFLQQSWANIAEDEEAEQRFLKQLEVDPHNLEMPSNVDDFQVVSKKKVKLLERFH